MSKQIFSGVPVLAFVFLLFPIQSWPQDQPEKLTIAVMFPGLSFMRLPWGETTAEHSGPVRGDYTEIGLGLGAHIYRAIQEQSSFSISYADEPPDATARSEVNRRGDWPFPGTNVSRVDAWKWETDPLHMTPNLERMYRAGRELGVDAVAMYYFRPRFRRHEWPLEVYIIDIERQRVYLHKGNNTETSTLVKQALSDFVAGRKP